MSLPKQHGAHCANGVSRQHCGNMGWARILAVLLTLHAINATSQTATVNLAWQPSASTNAAGYGLYYGESSEYYAWFMNVGTNLTATVAGLTPGVTYYFSATAYDTNGASGDFSSEVSIRMPVPPSIATPPMSQAVVAGTPVALFVSAAGDPPFNYQWIKLGSPIAGATNASLSLPQFASSNAGYYWCSVANLAGEAISPAATLTLIAPPSILTQPQSKSVMAGTAASFSSSETGTAPMSIQWYFGMTAMTGATNNALALASVGASNAGNYYFTVSNAAGAVTSSVATLTVISPPAILAQPQSQTVIATNAASFTSSVSGTAPLSFQWYFGTSSLAGATNSFLSWASVAASNAGNYHFTVSNAAGLASSSVATLTILTPPSILTQPQSQSVIATTSASLSAAATGSAPLFFQWYFGSNAITGASSSTLTWARVAASNGGNYDFTVSNAAGVVTSSVATLNVFPTNTIATVAGAYNGLFCQTNADGTPNITEATAGFLGNCVVASNGAYSAKIYLDGASCPLAGVFSITGSASNTFSLPGAGLSNLTIGLQLDLFNGSQQLTGTISSTKTGSIWTAPMLGYLATNALPLLSGVNLTISAGSTTDSPTNVGAGAGVVLNGILSIAGTLGDNASFSQAVPISTGGNVPMFASLYDNGGLLAGWVNLAGSTPVGSLTWIRPSGVLAPAGFPQGFDTVVQVGGGTSDWVSLVTVQALGVPRNDISAPQGFQFVCTSNCTCRALGRWVIAGNTLPHVVALCSTSCIVLAYATVTTAGATPGAYAYANLATPYPMTAGTTYYIFSAETWHGDQFYSNGSITTTSLASNVNSANAAVGTLPGGLSNCSNAGGAGQSYGPVNMLYTIP